jgi:hypothetical protein
MEREIEMIGIKNMEIPKNCSKCPFSATFPNTGLKNGVCNDLHLPFKRHPYCPLVEIVTCKNCKYWHDDGIVTTCDRNIGNGFPQDHYCADAERRE